MTTAAATHPNTGSNLAPTADGKMLDIARPTVIIAKKKKAVEKERISIFERKFKGAPVQLRTGLAEEYETEKSGREKWWRESIRETPVPHAYPLEGMDTFIKDLEQSQKTYGFKSDGRRLDARIGGKGECLLPGAYEYRDLVADMDKNQRRTYAFKNTSRGNKDFLNEGIKDKDIDVAPNQYRVESYGSMSVIDPKNKNYTFKSVTKRFPTVYFTPKTGPAPGQYNSRQVFSSPSVTSSFRSATPRFKTSTTKVPGPGMYETTYQSPQTPTIKKMGRSHGLFFACSFDK